MSRPPATRWPFLPLYLKDNNNSQKTDYIPSNYPPELPALVQHFSLCKFCPDLILIRSPARLNFGNAIKMLVLCIKPIYMFFAQWTSRLAVV